MHLVAEAADGLAQLGSDGFLAGFKGSQSQGYLLYDAFDAADAVRVCGHGLVSVSHGGCSPQRARRAQSFFGWVWFGQEAFAFLAFLAVRTCSLAYAWSKSDLEIPKSLLIWWSVPVARSRLLCLGMIARRPLAGFTHISWV